MPTNEPTDEERRRSKTKKKKWGGPRRGTGPKPKPEKRFKRLTVSVPPDVVEEVENVIQPKTMSAYVGNLMAQDVGERQRRRCKAARHVTAENKTVIVIVPMLDCEEWKRAGWKLLSLDDGRRTATLKIVMSNYAAATAVATTIKNGGPK